jgi:Flp pilus assembly protein TadD
VLGTLVAYWPIHAAGFVEFDDPVYFAANRRVLQGISIDGIVWAIGAVVSANWHPLTLLSHMLDATVFGADPAGPHLVNLALHTANVVLLFGLLRTLTGAMWPSAVVAGLFALHPLHVESVAWISERKDVLSTFFGFLALLAYVGYARRGGARRLWLVAAALTAGLLAKPMLVTLPFVMLLLDVWPLERLREQGLRRLVFEKTPLFALVAAVSLVTFLVQRGAGAVQAMAILPLSMRVSNALISYMQYIAKTFWPVDLAFYYPHPRTLRIGQAAAAALALAGATWCAWAVRRTRPQILVGWLWFAGMLIPVSGLVQVGLQAFADRYTYVPLVGLFVAVVWTIDDWVRRHPSGRPVAACAWLLVLAAFGALTWRQASTWTNGRTLFAHALDVTSNNAVAHGMMGAVLLGEGRIDAAAAELERSIQIEPGLAQSQTNLGVALAAQGRMADALPHFEQAVASDPTDARALFNLGNAWLRRGEPRRAEPMFRRAIAVDPDYAQAQKGLAAALRDSR